MTVLPVYIEIKRTRPLFEPRFSTCNLLLPAIIVAQRRRWHDLQNKDSVAQEMVKAGENQEKSDNKVSTQHKLPHEQNEEESLTLVRSDVDKLEILLDVQHFSPEEIAVKTVNGYVVIEGKHEEKLYEHGYISRRFIRRYALPEGCQADTVESKLSSDGVLTVTAPKQRSELTAERIVPIVHNKVLKSKM